MSKITRYNKNHDSLTNRFKKYLQVKKIKRMKEKFMSEIESIFEYNKNILKIDTFYSCHKKDRELKVPILNIRNFIVDEELKKPLKYGNVKCKRSMKYSNYLKNKRELENEETYEENIENLFNEIRWRLLVSAKYDEKVIDNSFTIIIKNNV